MHHLATSIDEQLRYAESAPLLTLCLTRRRKVLGDTDVDTLATIKAFAIHYNNQKLYDKGGPLLIEYTRGIRDVLGKDYKDSMQAVMLLSSLYAEIRKFKRAEPLFRDNIYRQQKIAGKVHPDTLKMKNSLALMYWNEKRYAEAEQIYLEIVEDHNRCLDFIESVKSKRDDPSRIPTVENINHHDVLKYISNCALVYREQGKFDKSTPLLNDCYVKFRNMLGEGHADTIKAAGNLGKQYMENGEFEKSESILSNCYEVSRTQLGETHLSTLKCISNLSELYLRTNQFELALPLLSTYIPAMKSSLTKNFTASHFGSEYHPEILRATYNLGRVYAGRGAHDDAEILLMDCLSKRQKKLGSSHPGKRNESCIVYSCSH